MAADDFIDDSDDLLLDDVGTVANPECVPFARLRTASRQTKRHEEGRPFMSLVAAVHQEIQRIPQPFDYTLYPGSASWLGSDERVRRLLGDSDDLTIWKLCYYGKSGGEDKDYAFGVRIRYARHFASLVGLPCWEFVFKVPPNHGEHQWFVGFSVRATKQSLAEVRTVVDAVIAELSAASQG
jgi:hypothetical protein